MKNRDPYLLEGQAAGGASDAPAKKSANGTRKARATESVKVKPKRARAKTRVRKAGAAPVKTPVVQIESGAASE